MPLSHQQSRRSTFAIFQDVVRLDLGRELRTKFWHRSMPLLKSALLTTLRRWARRGPRVII